MIHKPSLRNDYVDFFHVLSQTNDIFTEEQSWRSNFDFKSGGHFVRLFVLVDANFQNPNFLQNQLIGFRFFSFVIIHHTKEHKTRYITQHCLALYCNAQGLALDLPLLIDLRVIQDEWFSLLLHTKQLLLKFLFWSTMALMTTFDQMQFMDMLHLNFIWRNLWFLILFPGLWNPGYFQSE